MGLAGDTFIAALIGLGVPERELGAMLRAAGEMLGGGDIHTHLDFLPDGTPAYRLHLAAPEPCPTASDSIRAWTGATMASASPRWHVRAISSSKNRLTKFQTRIRPCVWAAACARLPVP